MNVRKIAVPLLAVALMLGGCASNKKTQKAEAQKRWATARAAVLASLAKGQLEAGNFEKSRQTIEEAQRLDPENAALRILYAKLAIEQGQLDVADRELAIARKLNPKMAEADYLSGVVYQRWQKPQSAYDYYAAAAQKEPRELSYLLAQAEMLVMLGRQSDALTTLQRRLDEFGNSSSIHDTIGQLFMAQGDHELAVRALRQAHVLASDDLQVREHLAMAHFYNQQYRDTATHVSELLKHKSNADRAELHVTLGECQLQLGQPRIAREAFDRAAQLNPSSATAWLSMCKASLELDDVRRAEVALRKAMSLTPGDSQVHLMLGYVRLRQERLNEALVAFRKANAIDSKDPVSLCMIGYVLEKSGRGEQAVEYYGKALQLKPDDELATHLLASVETGE